MLLMIYKESIIKPFSKVYRLSKKYSDLAGIVTVLGESLVSKEYPTIITSRCINCSKVILGLNWTVHTNIWRLTDIAPCQKHVI